jgi:hypothetical protein
MLEIPWSIDFTETWVVCLHEQWTRVLLVIPISCGLFVLFKCQHVAVWTKQLRHILYKYDRKRINANLMCIQLLHRTDKSVGSVSAYYYDFMFWIQCQNLEVSTYNIQRI